MARNISEAIVTCLNGSDLVNEGKIHRDDLISVLKMLDEDGQFHESLMQKMMGELDARCRGYVVGMTFPQQKLKQKDLGIFWKYDQNKYK